MATNVGINDRARHLVLGAVMIGAAVAGSLAVSGAVWAAAVSTVVWLVTMSTVSTRQNPFHLINDIQNREAL